VTGHQLDDADKEWVRKQVDAAPKLTDAQKTCLAELLRPARKGGDTRAT
jgi:hypothetical protein